MLDYLGIKVKPLDRTVTRRHNLKSVYDHPKWFELRLHTNRPSLQKSVL